MKQLIAISPILIGNHEYKPGDELPTHDAGLVEAWNINGAAVWQDNEEPKKNTVKAKRKTALAGLSGNAIPSAGPDQDLVSRPPSRKTRGAQSDPTEGRRKSNA